MTNTTYRTSWSEFLRGIANFLLAIVLLLSMSTVEIDFMLIGMAGLFITNLGFIKENLFGSKKPSTGILKFQ
jgi:hypothetical protein